MGKQIEFYALPSDEILFLRFMLSDPDVVLISGEYSQPTVNEIHNPLAFLSEYAGSEDLLFWKKSFPILDRFIEKDTRMKYDNVSASFVETGEIFYSISKSNAPVIEYSRSLVKNGKELMPGRIWVELYRLDEERFIHKGSKFEEWFDCSKIWIKKHFKRMKGGNMYFGPEAWQWYQSGKRVK